MHNSSNSRSRLVLTGEYIVPPQPVLSHSRSHYYMSVIHILEKDARLFQFVLNRIGYVLQRDIVNQESFSAECRQAIKEGGKCTVTTLLKKGKRLKH